METPYYHNGLWWFDVNNGKRYGYDMILQTVFEEWYDFDNNYHNRHWTLGEFNYSHSDRAAINHLFDYLTPEVGYGE